MKARSLTLAAAAAALGATFFGAHDAHAFKHLFCDGDVVRWPAAFGTVQNLCSVQSGSAQESAYVNAITRFNAPVGMSDMIFHFGTWPSNHCSIDLDDGWNDFALVDQAQIDGNLGSTLVTRDCAEIEEINVRMANLDTQDFFNPDEAFAVGTNPFDSDNSGHFAVLHEFGHAHGLSIGAPGLPNQHTTGFSIMRASPPVPLGGGLNISHSRLMPDDVDGGRFLYPASGTETNLMASAQMNSSGTLSNTAPFGTINKCRGDSVTYNWTTGNTGTGNVTSDQRFYIATNPTAHAQTGVTLATWFGATVNAEGAVHPSITANIPCGTAPGLYWVYHAADAGNAVAESVEGDNVTHNPMTIQVQNCGCP
jgi:hypothetical protein